MKKLAALITFIVIVLVSIGCSMEGSPSGLDELLTSKDAWIYLGEVLIVNNVPSEPSHDGADEYWRFIFTTNEERSSEGTIEVYNVVDNEKVLAREGTFSYVDNYGILEISVTFDDTTTVYVPVWKAETETFYLINGINGLALEPFNQ